MELVARVRGVGERVELERGLRGRDTPSTACGSCRGRSSGRACRSGSPGSTASPGRSARAARHDGFFPINLEHPDQLAEIVADLAALRRDEDVRAAYDIVAGLALGSDPAPYAAASATWWLVEFPSNAVSVDQVRGAIRDGPAPA
jgi:hypothetical protein